MYMHACMWECVCVCSFVSLCETKWYETKRKATLPTAKEVQAAQQQQQRPSQKSEQARESKQRDTAESAEYNEYRERGREMGEWASEQATTCPNWQGDTGPRATNSAAKRNWERKSERASERARGTQIERETNRRTRTRPRPRTRKCRLNQNACKNIVFSFVPALFTVFPFDSFLNIYFLFFMHFTLTRRLCAAEVS